MSSIVKRPNGHRWISYKFLGKRHTIRLGKVADDVLVQSFQAKLDRLISLRQLGAPLDADLAEWIFLISEKYHANLCQSGLVDARGPSVLRDLVKAHDDSLIARGRKKSTLCNNRILHGNLVAYFGEKKRVSSITLQDAEKFKLYLSQQGGRHGGPLAKATVSNRIRRAKSAFAYAVVNGWLRSNPFDGVHSSSEVNTARDRYITPELFERIISFSADKEFRLLLALVRYCGLRCPSEVTPLKWSAVNWESGTLIVHSSKTEAYGDCGRREVPLFTVIAPYVNEAWDQAAPGVDLIFPRHQTTGTAITNRLELLCRKAGEIIWPKPMVNMRASCERDLFSAGYKIDVIATWMGHSPSIALKHYCRVAKEREARRAQDARRVPACGPDPTRLAMYSLAPLRSM